MKLIVLGICAVMMDTDNGGQLTLTFEEKKKRMMSAIISLA